MRAVESPSVCGWPARSLPLVFNTCVRNARVCATAHPGRAVCRRRSMLPSGVRTSEVTAALPGTPGRRDRETRCRSTHRRCVASTVAPAPMPCFPPQRSVSTTSVRGDGNGARKERDKLDVRGKISRRRRRPGQAGSNNKHRLKLTPGEMSGEHPDTQAGHETGQHTSWSLCFGNKSRQGLGVCLYAGLGS